MVSHHFMSSDVTLKPTLVGISEGEGLKPLDSVCRHGPALPSMPQVLSTGYSRNPAATSMLAYTARMREISRARLDFASNLPPESAQCAGLEVRASHIPKNGALARGKQSQLPNRRRPLSLDELPGRPGNKEEAKQRRFSVPPELLSSTDSASAPRKRPDDRRVRISFVSASDLFDLVDFSLSSKRSRHEAIKLAKVEDSLRFINDHLQLFKISYDRESRRPSSEQPRSHDSKDETSGLKVEGVASPREATSQQGEGTPKQEENERVKTEQRSTDVVEVLREEVVSSRAHTLRYRPSRAKRMKLRASRLAVIQEDEQHAAVLEPNRSTRAPDISDITEPQITLSSPSQSKRTSDLPVSGHQASLPPSCQRKHAPDLFTSEHKVLSSFPCKPTSELSVPSEQISSSPSSSRRKPNSALPFSELKSNLSSSPQTDRVADSSISERKSISLPVSYHGDQTQLDLPFAEHGSVLPSTSSLTAVKVSRATEKRRLPRQDHDVNVRAPSGPLAAFGFDPLQEGGLVKPAVSGLPAMPRNFDKASNSSADGRETNVALTQRNLADHVNTRENTKGQRSTQGSRPTKGNNAHAEFPHGRARTRAQKKFRRLIFLRDYPDQSYHSRYS